MREYKTYITRDLFLTEIYNNGVNSYPKLHHTVIDPKSPVKKFSDIVDAVILAEKNGIIYKKHTKDTSRLNYHKNVRWYLGQLERKGKIKGFIGSVGRPKGAKTSILSVLASFKI